MSLLDLYKSNFGGSLSGSDRKPKSTLTPGTLSYKGTISDQPATSSRERGIPERIDISNIGGANQRNDDLGVPMQTMEVLGKGPGFVYERPFAVAATALGLNVPNNQPKGDGFDPLGFIGEVYHNVVSFGPAIFNAPVAAQIRSYWDRDDDETFWDAAAGKHKTIGEWRDDLRKKGWTDQDVRDVISGAKSDFDFGDKALSPDPLGDIAGRIALDPTTYLLGTGLVSKAASGVGILSRLEKAGVASQAVLSVLGGEQAIAAGQAAGTGIKALGSFLGSATKWYKRGAIGLTAGQFGVLKAGEALGLDSPEDDPRGGFVQDFLDFNRAALDYHPMSDNLAFSLVSAIHFPYMGGYRAAKAKLGEVKRAALGSNIRNEVVSALGEHLPAGPGRVKGVIEEIGGQGNLDDLIYHAVSRLVFKDLKKDPILKATFSSPIESIDEAIAKSDMLHDLVASEVEKGLQSGRWSGKEIVGELKDWYSHRSGAGENAVFPWDSQDAIGSWVRYSDAAKASSRAFWDRRDAVIGLAGDITRERLASFRVHFKGLAVDGKVSAQEVRRFLSRHPAILDGHYGTEKQAAWFKNILTDDAPVEFKALESRLKSLEKKHPTIKEMFHESAAAERAAPDTVEAPNPRAIATQWHGQGGSAVSVSRWNADRMGTNPTVDDVLAARNRAEVSAAEENLLNVLEDAGFEVDAVGQSIGAFERAKEPALEIVANSASLNDLRRMAALSGKKFGQDSALVSVSGRELTRLNLTANGIEVTIVLPSVERARLNAVARILDEHFMGYTVSDATGLVRVSLKKDWIPDNLDEVIAQVENDISGLWPKDLVGDTGLRHNINRAYIEEINAKGGDFTYNQVLNAAKRDGRVGAFNARSKALEGSPARMAGGSGRRPGFLRSAADGGGQPGQRSVTPFDAVGGPGLVEESTLKSAEKGGYLYRQVASEEELRAIAERGLLSETPSVPRQDGSVSRRLELDQYPTQGAMAVRVREDASQLVRSRAGQPYFRNHVSPDRIEILGGDGRWYQADDFFSPALGEAYPGLEPMHALAAREIDELVGTRLSQANRDVIRSVSPAGVTDDMIDAQVALIEATAHGLGITPDDFVAKIDFVGAQNLRVNARGEVVYRGGSLTDGRAQWLDGIEYGPDALPVLDTDPAIMDDMLILITKRELEQRMKNPDGGLPEPYIDWWFKLDDELKLRDAGQKPHIYRQDEVLGRERLQADEGAILGQGEAIVGTGPAEAVKSVDPVASPDDLVADLQGSQIPAYRRAVLEQPAPPELIEAGLGDASPLVETHMMNGQVAYIPGGFDGEWSLWDAWVMKAQMLDPEYMFEADRVALYAKLFRSQARALADPMDAWNRTQMAILSGSTPLLNNEAGAAILRVRNVAELEEKIASKTPDQLMKELQGAGIVYPAQKVENIISNAKKWIQDPDYFAIRPGEGMIEYSERIMSSIDGAEMKVGNFSPMLGDPMTHPRGTMDSRMVERLIREGRVPPEVAKRLTIVKNGNVTYKAPSAKKIPLVKFGKPNPEVPPHLRDLPFQRKDGMVMIFEDDYKVLSDVLDKTLAEEHPNLPFHSGGGQWYLWDMERGIFEPHTSVWPGAYKLPPMSREDILAARAAQVEGGYFDAVSKSEIINAPIAGSSRPMRRITKPPARPVEPMKINKEWWKDEGNERVPKTPGYVYHNTSLLNIDKIAAQGVVPQRGKGVRGLRGTPWESEFKGKNAVTWWNAKVDEAAAYPGGLLLRTKPNRRDFKLYGATDDHIAGKVPPERIQYLGADNQWHDIVPAKPEYGVRPYPEPTGFDPRRGIFWQQAEGRLRGATGLAEAGKAVVVIGRTADASTLPHELWHVRIAMAQPDEIALLEKVFGKDIQEKGAQAFEKYLSTGKAPTPELQSAFRRFKDWVLDIYRSIRGTPLAKQLNPEVKALYDRWLTPHLSDDASLSARAAADWNMAMKATGSSQAAEQKLLSRLKEITDGDVLSPAFTDEAQQLNLAIEIGRGSRDDFVEAQVRWAARRDAAVAAEIPIPKYDGTLDQRSPEWKAAMAEFEATLKTYFPEYTLKAPPKMALFYKEGQGSVVATALKERTALGDVWAKTEGLWGWFDWLTSPVKNSAMRIAAHQALMDNIIPHGATAKEAKRFVERLETLAAESKIARKSDKRWFNSPTALPHNQIEQAAKEVFSEKTVQSIMAQGGFTRLVDRSYNRFIRHVEAKGAQANTIEKALEMTYSRWQDSLAGDTTRIVSKTLYPIFRFYMDPRWWAMNVLEADILGALRYGRKATRWGGAMSDDLSNAAFAHQTGGNLTKKIVEGATDDTGWLYTRNQAGYIGKAFDVERPETTLLALRELQANDPVLVRLQERFGTAEDDIVKGIDDMLYSFDRNGTKKTIYDEARAILGDDVVTTPGMAEFLHNMWKRHDETYKSIVKVFRGNPDRTNLERIMNSYWLFWPLSYQVKAGKWLFDFMLNRMGGKQTNALGAASYAQILDFHREQLATNPDYAQFFEDHPEMMFAAQMFVPITPGDMGVSLSRLPRYVGGELGLWGKYKAAQGPIEAASALLNMGPFYTLNLLTEIRDELDLKAPWDSEEDVASGDIVRDPRLAPPTL